MEKIIYFEWNIDTDKQYSIQFSEEEDLAFLETENYIVCLNVLGEVLVKFGNTRFKYFEDFPSDLKSKIETEGLQKKYNGYEVLEHNYFKYCISKKIGDDKEEFLLCSNGFVKLESEDIIKKQMIDFLNTNI